MKLNIARVQKILFFILAVAAVFSSDLPKENIIPTVIVIVSYALIIFLWLFRPTIKKSYAHLTLLCFFIYLLITLPNASLHDVSIRDWLLRGVFPFLFLFLFLALKSETRDDFLFYRNLLLVLVGLWVLKITYDVVFSSENLFVRWTTISRDLLFPYNLLIIPFLYFNRSLFSRKVFTFFLISIPLLTVSGGYRMHFLLIALFFIYILYREVKQKKFAKTGLFITAVTILFVFTMSSQLGNIFFERIESIKGESNSSRVEEIKYAAKQFSESPIIGKGPAFPIPLEVTFYGRENYAKGVAVSYEGEYTHVTYMHNIVMYMLMNTGLLGSLLFFGFIAFVLFTKVKKEWRFEVLPAKIALIMILIFNLTAATFTLFQYHIMIVLLSLLITNKQLSKNKY